MSGGVLVFGALALGLVDVGQARTNQEWAEGWARLMPVALWVVFAAAVALVAVGIWRAWRDRRIPRFGWRSRLQLIGLAVAALASSGEWLYWSAQPLVCGTTNRTHPNYPSFVRVTCTPMVVAQIQDPARLGAWILLGAGAIGAAVAGTLWFNDPDRPTKPDLPVLGVDGFIALTAGLGMLFGPVALITGPVTFVVAALRYARRREDGRSRRSGSVVTALVLGVLSFLYALAWINIWLSHNPFSLFI